MAKKPESLIFTGNGRRAQFRVYDYNDGTKPGNPRTVAFRVQSLSVTAHAATSYMSAGKQHYHGSDFAAAWQALTGVVGPQTAPDFLTAWASNLPGKAAA